MNKRIESILQRFAEMLWTEGTSNLDEAVELYQSMILADDSNTRCWRDIDYTDQTRSYWSAANHYQRIERILKAFGKQRLMEDTEYAERMVGALRYWLDRDFENPNWWHNQIGTPQGIGNIAILLYPLLNEHTVAQVVAIVQRGSMAKNPDISARWTGTNLIWGVFNTLRHALLTENEELLSEAVERASGEITIGMTEGIQKDYSFFQHGPRLYTGGYGCSFVNEIAGILFLLQGTKFQISAENIHIFTGYVLDGLQHMTHRSALDWACVGREISRVDQLKARKIQRSLELMIHTAEIPRKRELQDLLAYICGKTPPDNTKYFDVAAMLCHRFHGIYVGAKFLNDRIWGAEICNNEGALCYNMSYGTHTCIMQSGGEYDNINAVWDYARVPGTTARTENDEQILSHKDWTKCSLPNSIFGGKQNGSRAVIYELAEHDGIQALVTDFAFEDGFVCLGAEIRDQSGNNDAELVTTVDQCFLSGCVTVEGRSVLHNGVRYSPLANTHICVETKKQTGSWRRNNAALSDALVHADVLTLTVAHPAGEPSEYAYMISAASSDMPKVVVLRNDVEAQAIGLPDGSVMAVFHRDCTISIGERMIFGEAGSILC